jgi:aspartokinase/homoserine dehydrogenase 1
VQAAFPVEAISYKEAMELACFGAKILHPLTILPMLEQQIPIYIKNTFNPTATGTAVVNTTGKSPYLIRGLSCIDQVALINVEGAGMIGVVGIAARVFQILQHIQVSVILISQASSEHSICFAVPPQQAETALKALNEQLATEMAAKQIDKISVDRDCAILAMIGDAMVGSVGILNKLCHSLAKANINIRAVAQGSSERNISIVIKREDVNKALQVVHAGLYLSNKVIAIGLIGPGLVGGALLEQIAQMSEQLKEKYHVQLCVRGIMTSKKMLLNRETIALQYWRDDLAKSNQPADLQAFTKHLLSDDMPHAVLIDCTASPMIAKHYADFIEQGLHVITPNKHTNGGDLEYYKKTKALAQKKQRYYLYEATVCAGLPVMSTLHDIINTGDEVLAIEGVFSGTLSYIFNELATGKPFSEIVLAAKKAGYTEPDPREDLSGMDVARKLICLAREIGRDVSLQDIHVHNLVPEALKSCSVEEFLEKLSECDAQMEKLMLKAREKNEKLYYMGAIRENGTIDVAIESFPAQHPFTRLNGTDNMLIFHTRRYHTQPLVIQGPGAGADVTAAGIFADLLRLASSLS